MKQRSYQRGIVFVLLMILSFPVAVFAEDAGLQVVKLQLRWDNQFQFAGYYAADWQGYYAKEGIKVEIIPAIKSDQSVLSSVKEVSEGRADFGIGSADILIANDGGADLRVVAVIMQRSAARYYLKQDTKFTSLSDLAKLKVARNVNDLIDIELQAMLIKEGIDPNLVKDYPHQAGMEHLISDKVQVMPGYELGTPYIANQKGTLIKQINPQEYGVDFYGDSLFTSGTFVDQNPELVEKFARASMKGWEYAFNHSEEIATKISQDLSSYEKYVDLLDFNLYQAQIMKALAEYPIIDVGHINPYRWQKMSDFLKSVDLIEKEVDLNKLIFDPVKLNAEKDKQRNDLLKNLGLVAFGLLVLMGSWGLTLRRTIRRKTREIISAQSSLIDAERKYKIITENASDVISVYNLSKQEFTYVSPSIFTQRGFTAEEALNETFEDAIAPEFIEVTKETMAKNVEDFQKNSNTINSYIDTVKQPCKNGDIIWVEISTKFQYNAQGELEAVSISRNIEERKKAENVLFQSEQRYRFLFEYSGVAVGFYHTDGTVISFNKKAAENMGGDSNEYDGKSIYDLFPKAQADFYMGRLSKASKTDSSEEYIDFVSLNPGDKWFSSTFKKIANNEGEVIGVQVISQDITERVNAEKDLRSSENRFREVLQSLDAGVIVHDIDSKIVDCNKRAEEMLGLSKEQLSGIVAIDPRWVFQNEDGIQLPLEEYPVVLVLNSKKPIKNKILGVYKPDANRTTWVTVNGTPIYNQMGEIVEVVISFIDISERKRNESELLYLGYHDQLTGLYNRRFYEEELKRLDTMRNLPLTIAMADMNGLKLINDSFGHLIGDEVLKKAANTIMKCCRSDDIVARLGGDEFGIIFPRTDSALADAIINRIKERSAKENVESINISISFGHETKYKNEENILDIIKRTEDHMYRHKLSESSSMRSKSIELIISTLYEKNNREMFHSKRVSVLCEMIASEMNFDKDDINQIKVAGLMHDIGKIGIDEKILNKTGKLNSEEWVEMQRHPEIGYRILSSVNEFSEIAEYVLEHQERWDGTGYPRGIQGIEIAIQARIITIADAYDAMTTARAYREALSEEEAIAEVLRCSGTQFDPDIAIIFVEKILMASESKP